MAIYTIKVRTICEAYNNFSEPQLYEKVEDIIETARPKIFDFEYPYFNSDHKKSLEQKILSHYYMYEIGVETPALWKLLLKNKMREIMPYYNQLLKSETIEFNPMHNVKYNTKSTKKDDGITNMKNGTVVEATSETNDIFKSTTAFADTPQGNLPNPEMVANNYLTNATINNSTDDTKGKNNSETNVNGNSDYKDNSEYNMDVEGKNSGESFSKMLEQFRDTFLNIDIMIINELNGLFMGVNRWYN